MPRYEEYAEASEITDNDVFLIFDAETGTTKKVKASTIKSYIGGNSTPPTPATPTKIEAENYSAQSGIQTESCSEGGLNVGFIDFNDWMEYAINPSSAGTYKFTFRLASAQSGAQFQIKSGDTVLSTVNAPNTGGFQSWQSIEVTGVTLTAGSQIIRLQSSASSYWNINWFEFVKV